jgi:hypothetical protein
MARCHTLLDRKVGAGGGGYREHYADQGRSVKLPLIGLGILLVSLAVGAGGTKLALAHDQILVAAFTAFVGLMGILCGGMLMQRASRR